MSIGSCSGKNPLDDIAVEGFVQSRTWLTERIKSRRKYLLELMILSAFIRLRTEVKHFRCNLKIRLFGNKRNRGIVLFHITANRFFKRNGRAIVGTLIEIGYPPSPLRRWKQNLLLTKAGKCGKSSHQQRGLFFKPNSKPTENLSRLIHFYELS